MWTNGPIIPITPMILKMAKIMEQWEHYEVYTKLITNNIPSSTTRLREYLQPYHLYIYI